MCTLACKDPLCGDTFVQPSNAEECDDGNLSNNDACVGMCKDATCGDSFVQQGVEQCDDGNNVNTDGCLNSCKSAACGDGVVYGGVEECDDANNVNTDSCVAGCKTAVCGDGYVRAGVEECDDGNLINGDGCEANCTPTPLPTECMNYAVLNDANRSVNNINGQAGCDNPFTTQWYRFTGAAGVRIPNTVVPSYRCGTHASGWMSGSYPGVQDGAVDRTICFNWSGNSCNWSEPTKVRNCGDFYVFYLKNVSWGCHGRYCGTN